MSPRKQVGDLIGPVPVAAPEVPSRPDGPASSPAPGPVPASEDAGPGGHAAASPPGRTAGQAGARARGRASAGTGGRPRTRGGGRAGARAGGRPDAPADAQTAAHPDARADERPDSRTRAHPGAREANTNPASAVALSTWRRVVEVEARRYAAAARMLADRDADLGAATAAAITAGVDPSAVREWLIAAGATASHPPSELPGQDDE